MPMGFEKRAIKRKGHPLSVMSQIKTSVVEVQATENCFAHAIIIAIAKAENDPEYVAYRRGYKIRTVVQKLLAKTGIDLFGGGGFPK